ncbi:hypothetical protein HNQ59_003448 [Chitinivorax tropicus]|uniref:Virulence factor n=1 Tax=Chitinivorax tropicus TaxID=714531 RepID=A0A840MLV6_9PROT|nr:hypothetical protein [Chitinivorax tropicus]MBB5020134.1 hypothetical protein [Chitinivorax tropicus]
MKSWRSSLIASWPRRIGVALVVFVLAMLASTLWLRSLPAATMQSLSDGAFIMRWIGLPSLLALASLALATACHTTRSTQATVATPAVPSGPFKVQVVGVQWLNPLIRRDYPTEWQLLWTLGLTKPNKNDEKVRDKPGKFTTIQPISAIIVNDTGKVNIPRFFGGYLADTIRPIGRGYARFGRYFYTVQPDSRSQWRELHGIHVQFALPAVPELPVNEAVEIVREAMDDEFEFYNPNLSAANIPADVQVTTGGASAGFHSLAGAMDYLQAHPDKTAWVMNWDAPDFPKYKQISENCTLLILAGPQFDTQREPLAWIGRPAFQSEQAFTAKAGQSRIAQAWQAALHSASEQAAISPEQIGYVIHDAGHGDDIHSKRLGLLGQTLTLSLPELDFSKQTFNTAKLLGDMRAGSAVTNLALAIAWSHQQGKPVLVAGTTEPDRATAVVVTPPAKPRLQDPSRDWFRARGEGYTYLPWWGLRKDLDWSKYQQGYSQ